MQQVPKLPDKIFASLPPVVQAHILMLHKIIEDHQRRIEELEKRLAKNSSNSSKPPSSDGPSKKPKSLREKSGKNSGGQKGHEGKTLTQIESPDNVIIHAPSKCQCCGKSLQHLEKRKIEKRQVFDIKDPQIEITEHQAVTKTCSCGHKEKAPFPNGVLAPVQYGKKVQGLIAYLAYQHFIPIDRICRFFEDLFGLPISPGTCSKIDKKLFQHLEDFEKKLKTYLLKERTLHFDETGAKCQKKLHWIHTASSEKATFYGIHQKRGQEAIKAFDILPHFQGWVVHDHWAPYFSFKQAKHALCNAHHLRELTYIHEVEKEDWALKMKNHLLAMNRLKKEANTTPKSTLEGMKKTYADIIMQGIRVHLDNLQSPRKKKPGLNLLLRLIKQSDATTAFVEKEEVPFTNNQAEQDIRMVKVKQKISGCFRTLKGGEIFCRVRSYLSTARKQGWSLYESLAEAIAGNPRIAFA